VTLWTDLKRAAEIEANTAAAVARRLIAVGLAREQRAAQDETEQGR